MTKALGRGHRAAGMAAVLILAAIGFAAALGIAGGAEGLPIPTSTTVPLPPPAPTPTVTTPTLPVPTPPPPPVTPPSVPVPTVTTPTVSTPSPSPPSPSPPASPPASQPAVSPPLVKLPSPLAPLPPPSTPSAASPASGSSHPAGGSSSGSAGSSAPARSSHATSSGPGSGGQSQTGAGTSFGNARVYRPSSRPPFLVGLPTPSAVARDFAAFIVPVGLPGKGIRQIRTFGFLQGDILSLLGFPGFLREGRASATRRPGGAPDSSVQDVLGQQATIVRAGGDDDVLGLGELPLVALTLALLSSLLLVGAVLPPGVVARTPVAPATYGRLRQPLALAAIGILVPVAAVALLVSLT